MFPPLKKVKLVRFESSEQGTFGALLIGNTFFCYTGELPWHDNQRNTSCIPAGKYYCTLVDSPKFGKVYQVKDVPERSHILFHAGNFVGDRPKYKSNSDGCILPGSSVGDIGSQKAVIASRYSLKRFMDHMSCEDFVLIIKDCYE